MASPAIKLHRGDLVASIAFGASVAVDTETLGLNPHRDRLCLVQLSAGTAAPTSCSSTPATTLPRT